MQTTVHIVDDDPSFLTTTGRLLRLLGYEVATYDSAERLLERLPDGAVPSCILLDVNIPRVSGPELQARLVASGLTVPIVFLTGYADTPTTVQTIKAGAEDFLIKPVSKDDLMDAIERAVGRSRITRKKLEQVNELRTLFTTLTPRERQVFERVVQGRRNKQIAHDLGTTERTIKAHRHRVMEKTQAPTLAALVLFANRLGLFNAIEET